MIQVTVDNESDVDVAGIINLRQAVTQVEAAGGGQIYISAAITEILLSSPLNLSGDVSIFGTATGTSPNVTIRASNDSRVFDVAPGADVSLFGIEITGGVNGGTSGIPGSIGNGGTNVSVPSPFDPFESSTNNTAVRNSDAGGGDGQPGGPGGTGGSAEGGGIFNQGSLTIIDGVVTGNTVTGGIGGFGGLGGPGGEGGPGINGESGEASGGVGGQGGAGGPGGMGGAGGTAEGGGIFNEGSLVLIDTLVTGNVANGGLGGAGGGGGQGGEGGVGGNASTLYENGNKIGTGEAGAGGLGGTGGAGGTGGTGGVAAGNNIENQGGVVEIGTSVIVGAGEANPGSGGVGGAGGGASISGVTGSGNGSNSNPTASSPGSPGAPGAPGAQGGYVSADIDNNGALLRVTTPDFNGTVGATIALSGISVADPQQSLSVKLSTDFGVLSIVAPGQTTATQGTSLDLDGNANSLDVALNTLSLRSTTPGSGNITITLQDASHSASTFVTATELCFLAGTLIRTPRGDVPIETLAAGDTVTTFSGKVRPIIWIGMGRKRATRGRRNAATPVIIRKGALADNVPHHDLRVTKAHAIYIDDVLIPVEFLVNHRSILWDDHAQAVSLYHLELDTHDVLVANGAPAESYRDDGNRWLFDNANSGWDLPPQEPCAPILTGGPIVDRIWRLLLERDGPRNGLQLTRDANLQVLADGRRIAASQRFDETYVFNLPSVPSGLNIVSRAASPAELGLTRDPRVLGVALRRLVAKKGTRFRVIEAEDNRLTRGFHTFEPDNGIRWTDGNAAIPTELLDGFTAPLELLVKVGGSTFYVDDGVEHVSACYAHSVCDRANPI